MSALRTAALRAQAVRATVAPAGARAYATPAAAAFSTVDANGIKVAGNDEGARTSSISLIVKAGSRYEPAPGVAHVLSNSLFKVGHPLSGRFPRSNQTTRAGYSEATVGLVN